MPSSPAAPALPAKTDRTFAAIILIAFAVPMAFAFFTNQVWEDYYITFRSSQNLTEGHGLVFQIGERVHTFTSPLGVLVPAAGQWLTGNETGALWFLRVISSLALAAGAWLLALHLVKDHRFSLSALGLAFVVGLLDGKTIAFSTNGMETGLLVFFTLLTWRELNRPSPCRWPVLAIGYAGLMWTRPDAVVLAAAMTASVWFFRRRDDQNAAMPVRPVLAAVAIGALLYAPWVLWAWSYYGSPVPHTIVAKANFTPEGLSLLRIATAPVRMLISSTGLDDVFSPSYYYFGGWPAAVIVVCKVMARASAFLWLIPGLPRPARAASLSLLIGGIYLCQIKPYPWYCAPWTLMGACALAGAAEMCRQRTLPWLRATGRIAQGVVAAVAIGLLAASAYGARHQQTIIEDHGRKQIGLWLKTHASAKDTVFLESLGYIGYFSGLKMLDFPGLSAPEVSSLVGRGHTDYASLIAALHPDWVIIRPAEYFVHKLDTNGGLADYRLIWTSNVKPEIDALTFMPGRVLPEFDSIYLILRRQTPAPGPRAD